MEAFTIVGHTQATVLKWIVEMIVCAIQMLKLMTRVVIVNITTFANSNAQLPLQLPQPQPPPPPLLLPPPQLLLLLLLPSVRVKKGTIYYF